MDLGAWWATAHGATKSWTQLSNRVRVNVHVRAHTHTHTHSEHSRFLFENLCHVVIFGLFAVDQLFCSIKPFVSFLIDPLLCIGCA